MKHEFCSRSYPSKNHGHILFSILFSFLFFTVLLVFPYHEGHCAQVTLAWDPDNVSNLAGYKVYYGTASGSYHWNIDVGNVTTYTLNGLTIGTTYYAAATAYTTSGLESSFSNQVMYTVPSCTYAISPSSASFAASGGTGSVSITTQPYCNWTTSSGASWITVNTGSGIGSGSMTYSIAPNTGTANLVASLTIAGNVFTITENGVAMPTNYTLSISKKGTGSGSVSTSPTGTVFSAGTVVTLNATADANSVFAGWSGGCAGTASTCQVTMNSNLSVNATFNVGAKLIITATAGKNGSISPRGQVAVQPGASQKFIITPSHRHRITNVQVDGVSKGPITSYTFSNVTANHTIAASFR